MFHATIVFVAFVVTIRLGIAKFFFGYARMICTLEFVCGTSDQGNGTLKQTMKIHGWFETLYTHQSGPNEVLNILKHILMRTSTPRQSSSSELSPQSFSPSHWKMVEIQLLFPHWNHSGCAQRITFGGKIGRKVGIRRTEVRIIDVWIRTYLKNRCANKRCSVRGARIKWDAWSETVSFD